MLHANDFKTTAGKINPLDFVRALRGDGWREIPVKNERIKVFQIERNDELFQANVPIDRNLCDFDLATFRAAETFADARGQSVEQTILELLNPVSDVLRVRLSAPNYANGSVFFDDAVRLYEAVKTLVVAAAFDVVKPAPSHNGARSASVSKFAASCRFAQTEVGSYVVSAVLPLTSDPQSELFKWNDESEAEFYSRSLARRTDKRIMESTDRILKVAFEENPEEKIARAVVEKSEYSVNFLTALEKLSAFDDETQLEVVGRWSPLAPSNRPAVDSFRLTRDYGDVLKTSIGLVREQIDRTSKKIRAVGRIERLAADSNPETRTDGSFVVSAVLDNGKTKRLTVRLNNAQDYNKACDAHKRGNFVCFSANFVDSEFLCDQFEVLPQTQPLDFDPE